MKRNRFSVKIFRLILGAAVCVGLLFAGVPTALADSVTINIGTVSADWEGYTFSGGVLTITAAGSYVITGWTNSNALAVAGGIVDDVNLTLDNVTIDRPSGSPMSVGAGSTVNVVLAGTSTLAVDSGDAVGIYLPDGAVLAISGGGELSVTGHGYGEGIGPAGSVTIDGGTVNATGGYNAGGNGKCGIRGVVTINGGAVTAKGGFAVGTGASGIGGTVTINGGTVLATAGISDSGHGSAGIGGGATDESGGTIVINGGNVTATGEDEGAGIGGSRYGSGGNITINGGTVVANGGLRAAGIGGGLNGNGGTVVITDLHGPTHVIARGYGTGAGIGGGENSMGSGGAGGFVTINGGTVEAYGGTSGSGGAGIGAGYLGASGGQTVIHGGTVTATGGPNAAGIGAAERGDGGVITITGGHVTATGGSQGAGIGCGYINNTLTAGVITISGGTVNATGGDRAAGIGGGMAAVGGVITISEDSGPTVVTALGQGGGAGIGGGVNITNSATRGCGGTITINGGTISATAGLGGSSSGGGAGIGGGECGNAGSITINGGRVTASACDNTAGIGSGKNTRANNTIPDPNSGVTINGGRVYATGSGAADIGGNSDTSIYKNNYNTINTFNGGSVRAGCVMDAPKSNSINLYRTVVTVLSADRSALADTDMTYRVDGGASISSSTDESGILYLWLPQTAAGQTASVVITKDGKEYAASGAVTADNTSSMEAIEQTYEIAPIGNKALAELMEGYAADPRETWVVSITNTGTAVLNNISVTLGAGEDATFNLNVPSVSTLAAGESAEFEIAAKDALASGDYSATVTIRADRMDDVVFHVTQKVRLIAVEFENGGQPYATRTVLYNESLGDAGWPTDPEKAGYSFDGWFTAGGAKVTKDSTITGDLTLTAKWTAITYHIVYTLNSGVVDAAHPNPAEYTVESASITLTNPTRAGYTFIGWSVAGAGGTPVTVTIPTGSTGDRSYIAVWKANPTYIIAAATNNAGYGSVTGANSYMGGTTATLRAVPKAGRRFVRWLEGSTVVSYKAVYSFTVSKNRALKAEFASIGTPAARAASAGYNRVRLSWGAVSGASGYQVYRATSRYGTYVPVGSTASLSFTDTGLTTGRTYYYKVRVKCLAGSTATYGGFSSAVSAKPALSAPASLRAARASTRSIRLSWSAAAGASKYEIYRAASRGGSYRKVAEVASTGFLNTGLTTGKTYYYKVRAYRLVGASKVYGPYSSVVSARP